MDTSQVNYIYPEMYRATISVSTSTRLVQGQQGSQINSRTRHHSTPSTESDAEEPIVQRIRVGACKSKVSLYNRM